MKLAIAAVLAACAAAPMSGAADAIVVAGTEQGRVNMALPDGGLPPVVGASNIQILRTTSTQPELADGDGWTYAHHMDLAAWKGRLYAAWGMSQRDEDAFPYKVVYSTSTNGIEWSAPADLFPRGIAWACRFYFYRASNGRMLAFVIHNSFRTSLLVREITAAHTLGDVFCLSNWTTGLPPLFDTSTDAGFVDACREAAGNKLLLEQQDYGTLLPVGQRIPWEASPPSLNGWVAGKAFCFYHREDGALLGLSKMGFVTVSQDSGTTWSYPVIPPTLFAGPGKLWGQRTVDGRFALAYNPDPNRVARYPLVVVHGDDGREFRDMRVVQGEVPRRRYDGRYKDIGAQYVRGLAEWSDDGTFADRQALWLIHSMNKEDIWISRVPLPVKPDETASFSDDFNAVVPGGIVPGWNIYSPRWAPVRVAVEPGNPTNRCLELRDGDPYDYARAARVFPVGAATARLRVKALQSNATLDIELADEAGQRPVRVSLTPSGRVVAANGAGSRDLGPYAAGSWVALVLRAGLSDFEVLVNGTGSGRMSVAEASGSLHRISLRTGPWRGVGDGGFVAVGTDMPATNPAVFLVDDFAATPDSDGDGMLDWQESVAGTDPDVSTSCLRMAAPAATIAGAVVSWQSVLGRLYGVERSTNLLSTPAFIGMASNLEGQAGWTVYTDHTVSASAARFYQVSVLEVPPVMVVRSEVWDGRANPHASEGVTLTTEMSDGRIYQVYTIGRGLLVSDSGVITLGPTNICFRFPSGRGGLTLAGSINLNRGTRTFAPVNYLRLELNDNRMTGTGDFVVSPSANDSLAAEIRGTGDVSFDEYNVSGPDCGTGGQLDVQIGGAFDARNLLAYDSAVSGNSGRDISIKAPSITVRGDILTYARRTAVPATVGGQVTLTALAYPGFDPAAASNTLSNAVTLGGQIDANAANGDAYDGNIAITGVATTLAGGFNVTVSNTRTPGMRAGVPQDGKTASDLFVDQSSDARTYSATHDVQWRAE